MANEVPNSYKDPYWAKLASNTESKLGLPSGLLAFIVSNGERSNADQVSEAGARTPFQIIPSTRKLAIDKYGVDPYLSPENAAEVAGRLLKDSLDRNKGDTALAVAEYHGGTDRANWGPRTRSYVQRVTGAQSQVVLDQNAQQSTFQRALASQKSNTPPNAIAAVYDAYKSGKMSPEEAKDFEADVNAGVVMLPRGASLAGKTTPSGAPTATMLPKSVTDAYTSGQMSAQERADLEADMKAGLVKLPPTTAAANIPTNDPNWKPATEQGIIQQQADPTLGQRIVGAGEAGLMAVTGIPAAVAMAGGTVKGIADTVLDGTYGTQQGIQHAEDQAMRAAKALTYEPSTPEGQRQAKIMGDAMQQAIPVMPLTAEMGALGATTKAAMPAVRAAAGEVAAPVVSGVQRATEAVQNVTSDIASKVRGAVPTPTPGTMASGGAAGTDVAAMRRAAAQELPVPVELTEGQATRDFAQQRFEQEVAKNPDIGAPLRERAAEQHKAVRQSFDAWVDQTGAEAPDLRATGIAVDKALTAKAARDKAEIRVAYKEADKSGEMASPVGTDKIIQALEENRSAESTAPVLSAARKELVRLGGAVEDASGNLTPADMTLGNMEQLRKFVNKVTGNDPTNIKFAGDLKRAIDATTEGAGGELYQKARGLRAKYANQYENQSVISDLLNTKRGMNDRKVALEDVFDRIVFRGSLDDLRTARRTLQTGGESGQQAWKEIQGAAVRYIRDEATKGIARDSTGQEMISASSLDKAIKRLDSDGKLDYLFGKKGAEQMRNVNDLAKVLFTAPPGTINTSNTASVVLAAMDMALSGMSGMPMPLTSGVRMAVKSIKDRKLKAQVQQALGSKNF